MLKSIISALIVTYNPDYIKLIMTIRSFILQNKIILQIVIADDGSQRDYFPEIKEYFNKIHFYNYKLIKNTNNIGTVKNIISGLKVCEGEYIKLLSPGDYLFDSNVLEKWLKYMQDKDLVMCGSDYVCYKSDQDGNIKNIIQKIHPQLWHLKDKYLKYNYILNNDIFLGAAVMCKTSVFLKYIHMIYDSVVYAEDNSYRIMVYCDEKIGYFPMPGIIYEIGTGVSTSKKSKWIKLLLADWNATDEIIKKLPVKNLKVKENFLKISNLRKFPNNKIKKFQTYISIKILILLKIRIKFQPRFTSEYLPMEWLDYLKKNII